MNFKAFLKNNLISESTFLFEEGDIDQQRETFIRSAYRRVFPKGDVKDVNQMWSQVRNKAYYHLTKGSKEETKKAVALAKSALNQAKARTDFKLDTENDKANDTRNTDDKIKSHLEDWGDSDLGGLKSAISKLDDGEFKSKATELIGDNVKSIDDLKNAINTITDEEEKKQLLELIKGQETLSDEELGVKEWKDKTFEDLESIGETEFDKIKGKLKDALGVDDEFENIDQLKDYLKKTTPDADTLQKLDKLLDDDGGEAKQVPVQTQQEPVKPQENKVPVSTANQEILDNIQKKQQEAELSDHLKKLGLDITSLDTGDAEVVQKIIDSGDPLLYDTYIAKNLPEESEIVQRIKREEEERQQVQREALERRTDRFEELKKSGKVLAGIGVIFDVLASALSGKGTNFFETMAKKQTLAKGMAEGITNQLSDQYEERISNEDSNHAKELDALKTNYDQRLKDLESQKADPFKTVAYKKLLTMASQKYNESLATLKDETQSASQRVADVASLQVFMSTDDLSSIDSTVKTQMTKVLSEKYPRQKITDENGEREETDDEYLQRIKKEAKGDDIQRIVDDANNDLSMCKEKEKELNDSFTKSLEDLKQNPEVQDEMKLAEQTYKSQKAIIESEYKKAVATETTRYEKTVHCLRKTMDENKRFFKNISVLAMYSDNPQDIIMQEMAARNKKLQDRAKLETGTEIFNEENCPTDVEELKKWFNNASKGSEGKPKKGKDRDDDDDDDGDDTPKKLTKPNDGDGGAGGADGGKEPDEIKKKEQKAQAVADTKKGFEELKTKFSEKPNAQKRLENFLKSKNLELNELDNPEAMSEEDIKVFNNALNEFKSQKLEKWEDLKALGLKKEDDSEYNDQELNDIFKDKDKLEKIKKDYGFDDDEGGKTGETKKTEPITVKPDNFEDIKKLGLTINGADGKPLNLADLDDAKWKELLTDDFKTQLKEQLESPEALKKLSENDFKNEEAEIKELKDEEQNGEKSLKNMNLKTLWTLLNNEGISIRALPGYEANMGPDQKAKLIKDYISKHKNVGNWSNLTESKTSQKRLSSLLEANNKKIQKRSLKKFAELLVNDVRTFG